MSVVVTCKALLVNLSMITHTVFLPFGVWSNPTTKAMVMSSHFHSSIDKGSKFLVSL